ncbi:metallophosphoesterase [Bosea sp. (in: a-proteobacteria)]|uniref:metallophosphoesterase n=1 Tax=Bosea sp. (in: a-proteobacteria) TaxID=1871050 RepID=UPI00262A5CDC|nr:metallophosphoesterase [Bosea sp. (in: a-proteobacteria)]MCO5091041.1 metallophosphoesterase [Bosea sp. (in: a-proteobacteria)]
MLFRRQKPRSYAPAPEGWVLYAVGDVHGRLDCLRQAQRRIDRDRQGRGAVRSIEIYLGDLVDRGPDSRGVIDCLIERSQERAVALAKANHELLLEGYLDGQIPFEQWRALGGAETLLSYGLAPLTVRHGGAALLEQARLAVPRHHLDFLATAKPFIQLGSYVFVHAGLRPGIALDKQTLDDLAWIREDFLGSQADFGFTVVHGHTPVAAAEFRANRINLDTGAYLTNTLSTLVIDEAGARLIEQDPADAEI